MIAYSSPGPLPMAAAARPPLAMIAEFADVPAPSSTRRADMASGSRDLRLARTPTRRRKLEQADYEALGAFRHALRRFLAFSGAEAEAQGLTPQQHQALLAIRAHRGPEPISIGELAHTLLIKNHSAVGLVDRLVARGLVIRDHSARDRRRVILRMTPAGARILETISRRNLGKLKASLPVFTDLLHALEQLELPAPGPEPRVEEGEEA